MAEISNPYVAGSPLSGTEMFFGRDDVFDFVRNTVGREHGDRVVALYGQRRTGKTSVLRQLHRHLDARYLCIFIDLHQMALNGLSSFLWELARHVRRDLEREHQITLPALDRDTFMADAHDAFRTQFLDQVWDAIGNRHLLLMVDEALYLQDQIDAGKMGREVFDYLRHLMQHYPRLRFLFALGTSLEDMEREYAILFSVGLYRKISFLERHFAEALITEPVRGCYELEPAAVARVYQTTSGHPYYTQLLCQCLFNRWREQPKDRLTEADVNGVLEEATESGSGALKNVWDDSTLGERVVLAGLAAAIGDEGREVRTADLTRFWKEHGLEIASGESIRAFKNLHGRDVLVGNDAPRFTVELQRRWVQKGGRPEWVRQEVADALDAETATTTAGVTGPVARSFKLLDPTPAPASPPPPSEPEPEPERPPRIPPPPRRRVFPFLPDYAVSLVIAILVGVAALTFEMWSGWFAPTPQTPQAPPTTETAAPSAKNEPPAPGPANAGGPTAGTGPAAAPRVGAPAITQAPPSAGVAVTPTAGAPVASAPGPSGASAPPPTEAPLPTQTPPPVLRGDDLHPIIFQIADKEGIPRVALLALARAETDRRSDLVEPATLEDARNAWPAVYVGWARQRIALTDIGDFLSVQGDGRPTAVLLQRAINFFKQADSAGLRAAPMLARHLPGPNPTRDEILKALVAYRAQNTGEPLALVEARDLPGYQAALTWAEGYAQAAAPPSPVVAVITPRAAQETPTPTPQAPVVTPGATAVAAKPTSRFNPAEPTVLQAKDWDASVAVTTWMLRSLGRDVSLANVSDEMLNARVVSPALGIHDARGTDLVRLLRSTWNEQAFNKPTVTFDEVSAMAGRYPIAIVGRAWMHVSGVRNVNADGELVLANPGGTGTRFGQQRLNREQFGVLGPFSAVWIEP